MRRAFLAVAVGVLCGCTTTIREEDKTRPLMSPEMRAEVAEGRSAAPAFIRFHKASSDVDVLPSRACDVPLITLVELAAPGYSLLPVDGDVNLFIPVCISAGAVKLSHLLRTLSAQTGYDMQVTDTVIEVSSFASREYSLPFLSTQSEATAAVSGATAGASSSSSGSSGSGSGSSSGSGGSRTLGSTMTNSINEWEDVVNQVRSLIGVDEGADPIPTVDAAGSAAQGWPGRPRSRAAVIHNRSLGVLRVYGPSNRLAAVDAYIDGLTRTARKQVRLDVRAIEVSFNDSKTIGINWSSAINTIFDDALGRAGITLGADYRLSGSTTDGSLSLGAQISNADDSIESLVDFLSSFGTVELRSEPHVTVFNGRTAYIGSGEEFGYIASVEQTISNGIVVATPQIERILIGVELAITARVTDDNRILLHAVPVISTFRGFDTFTIGNSTISQPRVVLNQLATEVYTTSGQTVHLGGLNTSRLSEAVKGLPVERGSVLQKILKPLLGGQSNQIERRELMLVVTPYLLNT